MSSQRISFSTIDHPSISSKSIENDDGEITLFYSSRNNNSIKNKNKKYLYNRGGSWKRMIIRGNHATSTSESSTVIFGGTGMQQHSTGGGTSTPPIIPSSTTSTTIATGSSSSTTAATITASTSGLMQTQQSLPSMSWQLGTTGPIPPSLQSPVRIRSMHGQNFSVDSATYREMLERRKSFRCRGSLGPTVASAPSVEQEDYRTPRPSVSSIKNGKSFDFGGGHGHKPYETNGLVKVTTKTAAEIIDSSSSNAATAAMMAAPAPAKRERRNSSIHEVSADFLRLNGSRQQFRNLLSARKKLGQMPPAYTRIDYSHDSIESDTPRIHPHGPVITVEDTASQVNLAFPKGSGMASPVPDSLVSSIDRGYGNAVGGGSNGGGGENGTPGNNTLTVATQQTTKNSLNRNNSRYGVPIDESAVKLVYKQRSQRLNTRVQITDRCLILAITGIIFMVLDTEMCGQEAFGINKSHPVSLMFRVLVGFSTLALLIEIIHYHINEILILLLDCGADDWRVVLTWNRIAQFVVEFLVCSICPIPWSGTTDWIFIEPSRFNEHVYTVKPVPIDVLLSLLMLGRVYLFGRFSVLHSKQFQDASTRTLAALNRIQVNFSFVMKTVLDQRPVLFLTVFTLIFWVTTAWTFAQCERIGREEEPPILYSNALWFIAISFMLNGYGDVVPKTNVGRLIAIIVGVIGAIISSILIAVISRKILLSQGQRNVNNFMNDSKLTQRHKDAAARVLQKTWHIYKCLQSAESPDHQLRKHQRKFLEAIHEFRRIKNKIRIFGESTSTSIQQMNRLMTEMHTSMQRLLSAQDEMRTQIEVLQRAMRNHFVTAHAAAVVSSSSNAAVATPPPAAIAPPPPSTPSTTIPSSTSGGGILLHQQTLPASTSSPSHQHPPHHHHSSYQQRVMFADF